MDTLENTETDFIVSSLLSELKSENNRKDNLIKNLIKIICGAILSVLLVVAGFLIYLYQFDVVNTETITANGVYTLVDSEGNVIAQDLSPEDINKIMEVINGPNSENSN